MFDFDGVIADSEILGVPMALEASLQAFTGKRFDELIAMISATTSRSVADCLAADIDGDRFAGSFAHSAGHRRAYA